jgi:hypothetical protein
MTDEELEELEIYLENEDNNTIYEELTKTDYAGLFEPLKFFRLFHSQIDFVKNNKNKPLFVIENLTNLELTLKQKIVFFDYLLGNLQINDDRQSRICSRQLEKLIDELKEENEKTETAQQKAELERVLDHLETLPNYAEKISDIKQAKEQYEKTKITFGTSSGETFDKKCELIIKKLKQLQSLEASSSINKKNEFSKDINHRQKDKDLTLDRAVLIFNYLLNYAKVNAHNTQKAEFISFLTGFSQNTIVQKLSRLHEKADLNFIGYKKDMKIVRNYFEKLSLYEITKAIDNDLET